MSRTSYRKGNPKGLPDFIEELILQNYGEFKKQAIKDSDGGFEKIEIKNTLKGLNPPSNLPNGKFIGSATIMVEGKTNRSVRYKTNGTPDANTGLFLGDADILEVGYDEIDKISFISADANTVTLQVQYYYSQELDKI